MTNRIDRSIAGIAVGVAAAVMVTRLMVNLLYEVKPFDPRTLATVAAVLATTALLACWLPATRASHVDPAIGAE